MRRRSRAGLASELDRERRADGSGRGDAALRANFEAQLFGGDDPWPTQAFCRELDAPTTSTSLPGWAIGWSVTPASRDWVRRPPFEYEIHTIGVDPAYQGLGIGRRLLESLLDFAGDGVVYLEVRTDNAAAIALYERRVRDDGNPQAVLPGQRCGCVHDAEAR